MRFLFVAAAAMAVIIPVSAAPPPSKTELVLANFSFSPEELHLRAGRAATIHFVNEGSGGHDFTAPDFFSAATMDAANRAKVGGAKGRVSLGKNDSVDVTLIPKAGIYKAHCSHFMHSNLGMTGKIVVD